MDWRTVRFDWNRVRAFLVAAEEGSFSAAARALATTQPTIGRQVAALEDELGVVLFTRHGRRLELTATGLDLVEHARTMGSAATRLSMVAAGQSDSLTGCVSIAASEAVAAHLVGPVIARLRQEYPNIEIEIVASIASSDLMRREADIAIRNFRPKEQDLIARRIRDSWARLYATPEYWERIGRPKTGEELAMHGEIVDFGPTDVFMRGLESAGLSLGPTNFPLASSNQLVQWELVKQGICIGIMMEEIGDRESAVMRVLPEFGVPVPLWLVAHREVRSSRRVRLVYDALASELGPP